MQDSGVQVLLEQKNALALINAESLDLLSTLRKIEAASTSSASITKSKASRGASTRAQSINADLISIQDEINLLEAAAVKAARDVAASTGTTQAKAVEASQAALLKIAELRERKAKTLYEYTLKTAQAKLKNVKAEQDLAKMASKNFDTKTAIQRVEAKSLEISLEAKRLEAEKVAIIAKNLPEKAHELEIEKAKEVSLANQIRLMQEQVNLNLEAVSFDDTFKDSGLEAIGTKFAQQAVTFSKELRNGATMFVDTISSGMNGAIDAFGSALRSGFEGGIGNTLREMGLAMIDGMQDVLIKQVTTQLKVTGNRFLSEAFGVDTSTYEDKILSLTEKNTAANIKAAGGDSTVSAIADDAQEKIEDKATGIGSILDRAKTIFSDTFGGIFDVLNKGASLIGDALMHVVNSLSQSMASSTSSSGIGGLLSGALGLFTGGSSFGLSAASSVLSGSLGTIAGSEQSMMLASQMFAKDGIMSSKGQVPLNTYANGGIASSPQLALYGEGRQNEAYVPLPDGRSIPVAMEGGGSTINNVNVVVNYDGSGSAQTESTGDATQGVKDFARLIKNNVQQEILAQTRPGGMLA